MRVKSFVLALFTAGFSLGLAVGDSAEYPYSTEEARALGKKSETVFDSEFGDTKGPFKWVAGADVNSRDNPIFRLMWGGGAIPHSPKTVDPRVVLAVDYFVNPKGGVFGVVYRKGAFGGMLPELEKPDLRPREHIALSEAARYALQEEKFDLLDSILKAGFRINLPTDRKWRIGNTLLHDAALFGDLSKVEWLLQRGADRYVRDTMGQRPIDYANKIEIFEALRVPEKEEELVSGFPIGAIEEAFFQQVDETKAIVFLSFEKMELDPKLLELAKKRWPNARIYPASEMTISYRHVKNKETGVLHQLSLVKTGEGEYQWTHRIETGPFLGGGGISGVVSRKYGYWITKVASSWDE